MRRLSKMPTECSLLIKPSLQVEKPIFTVDITKMQCTMHKSEEEVSVALAAGPNNLLVGKFPDGTVHETELINLMLTAPVPRKEKEVKKKPAMKRPSGAVAVAEAEPVAEVAVVATEPPAAGAKDDYGIMYYKNNSIGLRAKFGAKSQVLSFGGMRCTRTEAQMRQIAQKIIADLHAGMNYAAAKRKGNLLAGMVGGRAA